ncbi:MAG: DnaJ C-terminal domain-containing protein [Alphaproteobacteria bacterium]
MANPYQILGVTKSATADELKSAYRKLAKKLHPDVNPGRKDIEHKFKEITAAYDLVSDPVKRAKFDRGELDDMGNERGGFARGGGDPFGQHGGGGRSYNYSSASSGNTDPFGSFSEDLFADLFGGSKRRGAGMGGGAQTKPRGGDATYTLTVGFIESCLGGKQRVTMASGKTIDVNVPPGTENGTKLRLKGLGQPGPGGAGDAIIDISVTPHPWFTRKDRDINLEAPVSLSEALLGASIKVPTLDGTVAVKVHKGANTGTLLRLKGKGVPAYGGKESGDLYVRLKVVLPDPPDHALADIVEKWSKKHAYDPRAKLGWES